MVENNGGQMKQYELNYGNTYKIGKGSFEDIPIQQYENVNPFYNIKKIITVEDGIEIDLEAELEEMRFLVDNKLYKDVKRAKTQPVSLDGLRIKVIDGKSYPSVTTILTPEKPDVPNLDLYALRGTMWDKVFNRMVGEATYFTDFGENELAKIKPIGGMEGHSLQWVFDNNAFDFRNNQVEVVNEKDVYYGTYDADGFYNKEPALFDCKSGNMSKQAVEKAFMQLAAYSMAKEEVPKWMVIIPTRDKKEIASVDVEGYYRKFLIKREEFRKVYNV